MEFLPVKGAHHSPKFHARPKGLVKSLSESGIDGGIGPKPLGIRPLDHENNKSFVPLVNLFREFPEVPSPTGCRRIRKESHTLLHQGHGLHFHPNFFLAADKEEIRPTSPELRFFGPNPESQEFWKNPAAQEKGKSAVWKGGIKGDQKFSEVRGHRRPPRLPSFWCPAEDDRSARAEEFQEPARIGKMGHLPFPIHPNRNSKAVQPPQIFTLNHSPSPRPQSSRLTFWKHFLGVSLCDRKETNPQARRKSHHFQPHVTTSFNAGKPLRIPLTLPFCGLESL